MIDVQTRRAAQAQSVGALELTPFPRIQEVCPKLSKAFPDDVRALQDALDLWLRKAEDSLRKQFDRNGG